MPTLDLTPDETQVLYEFLERYLLNLKVEAGGTDDRKFLKALKQEEKIIEKISGQLKNYKFPLQ
jgi:hypothetical protein